jgi:aspartyl/glutamyl-tRNA(Asn/Gln) amidotransferase C subunit
MNRERIHQLERLSGILLCEEEVQKAMDQISEWIEDMKALKTFPVLNELPMIQPFEIDTVYYDEDDQWGGSPSLILQNYPVVKAGFILVPERD